MTKDVKLCGVKKLTSKKGKEITIIFWVEKMEETGEGISIGYECKSGFANNEDVDKYIKFVNKNCSLTYFFNNGIYSVKEVE